MKYYSKKIIGLCLICLIIGLYKGLNDQYMYYLKEEKWMNLNKKQRLRICEYIKDEQLDLLDVNYHITVQSASLQGNTVGCYVNKNKTILIDNDYLMNKSAKDIITTICHESYHAYQFYLIEYYESLDENKKHIPAYNIIEQYKYDFDHYTNEGEEYFNQKVEEDAREYASKAVLDYQF